MPLYPSDGSTVAKMRKMVASPELVIHLARSEAGKCVVSMTPRVERDEEEAAEGTTHILLPLMTQSPSAFFLAVVFSANASLPLDDSDRAKLPSWR